MTLIPHQKLAIRPKHIIKGTFNYLANKKLQLKLQPYIDKSNLYWTSSARFALQQLLQPKLRVGLPAFTCNVITQAIKLSKCKPVFYDSGITTDINKLKDIITEIDTLILPYNMGFLPDIKKIQHLCKQSAVNLIEDCAQALGATYNNQPAGSFANTSIYSFNISKGFFMGGLIASNSKLRIQKSKSHPILPILTTTAKALTASTLFNSDVYPLTDKLMHTQLKKHHPPLQYRFPKYAAYVIEQQLKDLKHTLRIRRQNAQFLTENLNGIINFEKPIKNSQPSWLYFTILEKRRNKLIKHLRKHHIDIIPSQTFYNLTNNPKFQKAQTTQDEQLIFALHRPKSEIIKLIKAIIKWE